jgi:soluble lytic murein transglycosylase-like protein
MLRSLLLSTMIVASIAPAHARRVELMSFAAGGAQAVVEDTLLPHDVAFARAPMEAALSSNFAAIGSGPPVVSSAPLPTDGLSIPLWLQTGVAAFAGSPASTPYLASSPAVSPPSFQGCGDSTYQPRHDLPSSTQARRAKLFPLVAQVACEAGIPVGLFDALIVQESRYQMGALSPKGAAGLTQLMPGTARELGVRNSWDPLENLRGGALYLRRQLNEFGRVDLALAAYNAGPGRVRGRRRVPAIAETMNYVAVITRAWSAASRAATVAPVRATAMMPTFRSEAGRGVDLASYSGGFRE